MSEWKQRRFWSAARVIEIEDGYTVELDNRRIRTPNGAPLVLPGPAMAEAIAAEWMAQDKIVNPLTMPMTRSANSAIDKVAPQRREVVEMLAGYGDSDLLCYRADAPEELIARQNAAWNPPLDWAAERFGARLMLRNGVMHKPQDSAALGRLAAEVEAMTPFQLTGLHDLVSLTGSLVLGLAAARDWRDVATIWALSRVDETWQTEHWGADEEAAEIAGRKWRDFCHAKKFLDFSLPPT